MIIIIGKIGVGVFKDALTPLKSPRGDNPRIIIIGKIGVGVFIIGVDTPKFHPQAGQAIEVTNLKSQFLKKYI